MILGTNRLPMRTPLKIICLNIEMDRHFERILPFLKKQQPDIILLQEVLGKDVELLEKTTNMHGIYTIQNIICSEKTEDYLGLLTLTHLPIIKNDHIFYRGDGAQQIRMKKGEAEKTARGLTMVEVVKDHQTYCVLNTHFTWTPNGQPNKEQYQDLECLLAHLTQIPAFVLCGDFNAPRGTPIFDTLAANYKDNIPADITTTIDKHYHRCGDLGIVVDGVFTTPGYEITDIQVVDHLSDHCALLITVEQSSVNSRKHIV